MAEGRAAQKPERRCRAPPGEHGQGVRPIAGAYGGQSEPHEHLEALASREQQTVHQRGMACIDAAVQHNDGEKPCRDEQGSRLVKNIGLGLSWEQCQNEQKGQGDDAQHGGLRHPVHGLEGKCEAVGDAEDKNSHKQSMGERQVGGRLGDGRFTSRGTLGRGGEHLQSKRATDEVRHEDERHQNCDRHIGSHEGKRDAQHVAQPEGRGDAQHAGPAIESAQGNARKHHNPARAHRAQA